MSIENEAAVSVDTDGLTGEEFVDELVIPVMLAAGYQPETIDNALASARQVSVTRTIRYGGTE